MYIEDKPDFEYRGLYHDMIKNAISYTVKKGQTGTLSELAPKPHPWLYAETARVGLGIPYE